ncbi:hypothetical protein SISNIDRAFT_493464 [Sistotremastrum niveocremeum HHB9708]|uniref:Uncharacterized protein n=1 Tax=Sistotremastrum niveocremeum HHB9708 TaxID=1314777 RepID=A0A164YWF8_9AGAM|nr:hypothetical protein SISNIDRAFT_493464 [Sistotremastrum niveocremeum HHB9708]
MDSMKRKEEKSYGLTTGVPPRLKIGIGLEVEWEAGLVFALPPLAVVPLILSLDALRAGLAFPVGRGLLLLLSLSSLRLPVSAIRADDDPRRRILPTPVYPSAIDPREEDKDGGGTEGYERWCWRRGYGMGGFEVRDDAEGGVVRLVLLETAVLDRGLLPDAAGTGGENVMAAGEDEKDEDAVVAVVGGEGPEVCCNEVRGFEVCRPGIGTPERVE